MSNVAMNENKKNRHDMQGVNTHANTQELFQTAYLSD